ncbi:hypothetical protein I4U23_019906 [Adineta vaga]|nr:hypothetical protein I4U23_019906 [Adineta vaga]
MRYYSSFIFILLQLKSIRSEEYIEDYSTKAYSATTQRSHLKDSFRRVLSLSDADKINQPRLQSMEARYRNPKFSEPSIAKTYDKKYDDISYYVKNICLGDRTCGRLPNIWCCSHHQICGSQNYCTSFTEQHDTTARFYKIWSRIILSLPIIMCCLRCCYKTCITSNQENNTNNTNRQTIDPSLSTTLPNSVLVYTPINVPASNQLLLSESIRITFTEQSPSPLPPAYNELSLQSSVETQEQSFILPTYDDYIKKTTENKTNSS